MYAKVLIEYNSKSVDKTFTYHIPSSLKNIKPGMKVLVPFNNRLINGFVLEIDNNYNEEYELKDIARIVDAELVLNSELLAVGEFLHQQTLCSKITAYQTMLPSSLKVKDHHQNYHKYVTYIELVDEYQAYKYLEEIKNKPRQKAIIEQLLANKRLLKKDIASSSLKTLIQKNIVKEVEEQIYRLNPLINKHTSVKLTPKQEEIVNSIDLNSSDIYLIHGVTGSGKTEIYMSLIDKIINKGQSIILLVPEITLTTQMVNRFYERFGNQVAILHSALSNGEKYDEYLKILRDEVKIVIGARSAIFAPLKNLGLIIIDEEHSENYKQENTPRYHALDIAKFRSNYNQIPIILGSATPSLESMARARKGVYHLLELSERVGTSTLPKINIIDMTKELKKGNILFSEELLNKINNRLTLKEQIILLLNRRGYSTTINCSNCGFVYKCPHCDISLTYHKTSNNLRCHYCGYTVFKPTKCPNCHEDALTFLGTGTEKLEQQLKQKFPEARIVRMDTDTTQTKGSHQKIIDAFANHDYDILLGTQMISKGLDFPLVTLVGVINADTSLNIPDFRSNEKTFALLSQVAGRAGRSNKPGEVLIQTYNPQNYILECVANNNYLNFYNYEMKTRQILKYPPYYYLTSIKIASKDYQLCSAEITKVRKYLTTKLNPNTIVLGPTPAANFKINNVYRFQIILKYKREPQLLQTLKELDKIYILNKNANLEIDINPNTL